MPPAWFLVLASALLALIGIGYLIKGDSAGVMLLLLAIGWGCAAFLRAGGGRRSQRRG